MARVNVFLKDDLLAAIDRAAAEARVNRSALVQLALTRYLDLRRDEREAAARKREMDEAVRQMDALADKLGDWDPGKVIREFRDSRSHAVQEPRRGYRARRGKARR